MKQITTLGLLLLGLHTVSSQVIDVHIHSYTSNDYWGGQGLNGVESPNEADLHFKQTIDQMNKHNIRF